MLLSHASSFVQWIFRTSQPAFGFFLVIIIWSIFIGDWKSSPSNNGDISLAPAISSEVVWKNWGSIKSIFFFGDSYTTYWFDYEGTQPAEGNPLGNFDAWYKTKDKSKALDPNSDLPDEMPDIAHFVWSSFLTTDHSASSLLAYNLAYGGSLIEWGVPEKNRGELQPADPPSLKQQVDTFEITYGSNLGKLRTHWTPETTLFSIWSGINDLNIAAAEGREVPWSSTFASYLISIDRLYRKGARNFLVFNLPEFDRIDGAPDNVHPLIPTINEHIEKTVHRVRARLPGITLFFFDVHTLSLDMLADPKQFTFLEKIEDTTTACPVYAMGDKESDPSCPYPASSYYWRDSIHIMPAVHQAIALKVFEDCFNDPGNSRYCSKIET